MTPPDEEPNAVRDYVDEQQWKEQRNKRQSADRLESIHAYGRRGYEVSVRTSVIPIPETQST